MFFEEVEVGRVRKSDNFPIITKTEIDFITWFTGINSGFVGPEISMGWSFRYRGIPGPYVPGRGFGLMIRHDFLADAALVCAEGLSFRMPV